MLKKKYLSNYLGGGDLGCVIRGGVIRGVWLERCVWTGVRTNGLCACWGDTMNDSQKPSLNWDLGLLQKSHRSVTLLERFMVWVFCVQLYRVEFVHYWEPRPTLLQGGQADQFFIHWSSPFVNIPLSTGVYNFNPIMQIPPAGADEVDKPGVLACVRPPFSVLNFS